VWWQCTEEKESNQPPVQKIVTEDKQERAEPSLQPISGAPLCPPGTGGFTLGSPISNKVVEQYLPPRLIGSWGNEANLGCWYMRDSGQKESDGSVIYEEVILSAQYQTSGTFEARPTWARELYCIGGTNRQHGQINNPLEKEGYDIQLDETHYDLYSSSHVSRIIYPVVTFQHRDISFIMKTMADILAREIETTPYAIRCPST